MGGVTLNKLRRLVRAAGIVKVSEALGYRSVRTIQQWFKNGEIPRRAKDKVEKYLKGEEA